MDDNVTPSQAFLTLCSALYRSFALLAVEKKSALFARLLPIVNELRRSRDKEITVMVLFFLYKMYERYHSGIVRKTKSFYSSCVNLFKETARLALPSEDSTLGRCKTVAFAGSCSWASSRIELLLHGSVSSYLGHFIVGYYVFTLPLLALSASLDTRVGELGALASVPLPPQIVLSVVDTATTVTAQANQPSPPLARSLGPVQEMSIPGAHTSKVADNKSIAVIARKVDETFEMVGQCFCVADPNSTTSYRIFTADHVLSKSDVNYLVANNKTFVIEEDIIVRSGNDIAYFDLPLGIKATLGIRNLDMGSVDFNTPVSVLYINGGITYRSTGSVSRGIRGELITRFSTFPSVSGAVITQNSKAVGVHLGAKPDEGFNYGRSLIKYLKQIELPRAAMILPPSVQERIGSSVASGRDWEESYFNMTDFNDLYNYGTSAYPELFKHFNREIADDLKHAFKHFNSDYDDYEATQRRHMMEELREAEEDDGYTPNSSEVRRIARKYAQIFSRSRESVPLTVIEKNKKPFQVGSEPIPSQPLKAGGRMGPRVTINPVAQVTTVPIQTTNSSDTVVLESLSQTITENLQKLSHLATQLGSIFLQLPDPSTTSLPSSDTVEEDSQVQESVDPVVSQKKRKKSSKSTTTPQVSPVATSASSPSTATAPSPSQPPKSSGTSVAARH